jgi:hypothetical protein
MRSSKRWFDVGKALSAADGWRDDESERVIKRPTDLE